MCTDRTYAHGCYSIPSQLTLLSYSTPWPILTKSVLDVLTSLCTAFASAVYTCAIYP
ncbi:CCT_1a_G0004880.mRNA.1.CDS.1 [Saccharomyces cerevisiae]|nr:CCT_1a_G0004880.mRNA.1.CDS.1 [Saccharomyces cerevisiae]CAI7162088.1 CCT_1a_G0004880.mRNA.1.CDS.1 [Saccharomyces cerevisiae]